jgi:hypothetical protein
VYAHPPCPAQLAAREQRAAVWRPSRLSFTYGTSVLVNCRNIEPGDGPGSPTSHYANPMSMEGAAPQEGEGVGVGGAAMNSPRRAPITPSQTVWPCIEEVRGSLP